MKKTLRSSAASLVIAAGSLGLAATSLAVPTGSASASAMMKHSWHGTVEKVNAKMGSDESFALKVGKKTYKVEYTSMTRFTMGSSKDVRTMAMITVTGTVSGSVIHATKLSL